MPSATMPTQENLSSEAQTPQHFDAIIVGASIAGCIGAIELANKGWRVAVIEKRKSLTHYKKICTHIIHPGAVNKLRKLGILDGLEKQSAQMTCFEVIHGDQSVLYPFKGKLEAANIERQDLDPALKRALLKHQNIELMMGHDLKSLITTNKRVTGLIVRDPEQVELSLYAALIIGADGRQSQTAKLAGGKTRAASNRRIAMFSYFEAVTRFDETRVWALEKGQEYMGYFPNKRRVLLSWYMPQEKYLSHKLTDNPSLDRLVEFLAEKGITVGERQESIMVAKITSPQSCRVSLKNTALIGDAKLTPDPLTGFGCQWAINSAALLASCIGKPPSSSPPNALDHIRIRIGITLYNLIHALRFGLPSWIMSTISNHGAGIFNKPVYGFFSWLTRAKQPRST